MFLRQYLYDNGDLKYLSCKKDKYYKMNKSNEKEIRVLCQFSNGVIAEVVNGQYKGKDSGDVFFFR